MPAPLAIGLDIGADIELGGAIELLPAEPDPLPELVPQAASERAAAEARAAPAIRAVFTTITPFSGDFRAVIGYSEPGRRRIARGARYFAVNVMVCQPVAPSGTVPARSWVWV
ncbi:hypothetical protein GCM10017566_24430 [Amycolatopsis bartoniae]|uniref:Uncharacterized protein n=1 Tax=Amycolatopsis bartoniae TaxID=941986 RepID=A0A8H9IRR6_9PSEU|nr:hypothetical protein GCM10017566_24430 [Amycolatopsis bartoniae]